MRTTLVTREPSERFVIEDSEKNILASTEAGVVFRQQDESVLLIPHWRVVSARSVTVED